MSRTARRRPSRETSVHRLARTAAAVAVVGLLTACGRSTGDFGRAEDLAQEALADALAQWPQTGVPANPGAWLTAVALHAQ